MVVAVLVHDGLAAVTRPTSYTFCGLWPVEDFDMPHDELIAQADADLPALLEEVGARLIAPPVWSLVPYPDGPLYGIALGCRAPAVAAGWGR